MLKEEPDFTIKDSRKIVDTRNRIIHGYDSVSEDIIWMIVNRSLPKLKLEVDNFLKFLIRSLISYHTAFCFSIPVLSLAFLSLIFWLFLHPKLWQG
ncbi:HepT-like ribonuclease domain-containing protein [Saccharicrinis fermentans]|uniref:HepT-like ribonuclease domain-containing protein n=1 Tax=Saccharicrinis fermentans TaxID=982 RepID=UPI0009DD9479